ncbi:MAG: HAMP domain-containing sensor histidine kinase [Alphaproteobacteria bacterium]|nr:HAMP domain-containing sensor histidine kinase [Alphaproteobacteria bacterium]
MFELRVVKSYLGHVKSYLPPLKFYFGQVKSYLGYDEESFLLPGLPVRVVLLGLLIFFGLQFLFTPFYLNIVRQNNMHLLIDKATITADLFPIGQPPDPIQAYNLYQHHKLEMILIAGNETQPDHTIQLIPETYNPDNAYIYDLGHDNLLLGIWEVFLLFNAETESKAMVKSIDVRTGNPIFVVFPQESIRAKLIDSLIHLNISNLIMGLLMALLFRFYLVRDVFQSIDQFMLKLYGNAVVSVASTDKIAQRQKFIDLQKRIESHIAQQARLASLGAGSARLAHDLRNVLTSLQLYVDKLDNSQDSKTRDTGKRMQVSVERAIGLCDWTTRYSTNTKKSINRYKQLLHPLIDEVMALVRLHDVGQSVKLINKCPPDIEADCERTLLFRIIYNIVLNAVQAIQASNKKGEVCVLAEPQEAGCIVRIIDTGPGMDAEIVEKLFTPYQGSFKPGGSGLGMAIAEELVNWHGGKLELAYTNAQGSCFQFDLPDITDNYADKNAA